MLKKIGIGLGICTLLLLGGCGLLPFDISTTPPEIEVTLPGPTVTSMPTTIFTTVEPSPEPVTPTATEIEATRTMMPSMTMVPTSSDMEATKEPTVELKVENIQYEIQSGSPAYLANFVHKDMSCNWMGVAGQVFDENGNAVKNVVVLLEGELNGEVTEGVGLTGSAQAYGASGYEIKIDDAVVESNNTLMISLFDLEGNPITTKFAFSTYGDCNKNLILINFVDVDTPEPDGRG
ncbi:MAG: hypothetical protein JEZ06_16625 [Anaerolineaceae bacterium]|nr:hypothetical protein [Anaerolineaceae bacterium]